MVVLKSVSTYILFLPFSLPAFVVNGQTSLIFVILCDLIHYYVLLIHLIHRFILILHVTSLSFVGPKIFLNTFLPDIINLSFIAYFKTHVSQAYFIIGLIKGQYSFSFDFLETNLLLKKNWLA